MQKVHHCHIGIPMQLIIISSNTREDMIFFFGVTEVLPRYGARPDARDVAGKNASNFVSGSYVRRWLYIAKMYRSCQDLSLLRRTGEIVTLQKILRVNWKAN